MNLGLDHPHRAAELPRSLHRAGGAVGDDPSRNGYPELAEDLLGLKLVDLHLVGLLQDAFRSISRLPIAKRPAPRHGSPELERAIIGDRGDTASGSLGAGGEA
jgi:hypothetical protein